MHMKYYIIIISIPTQPPHPLRIKTLWENDLKVDVEHRVDRIKLQVISSSP